MSGYRSLVDGLTCDPKDRHVLAAAVRADAAAIVTFNVRDFPASSVEAFEIEIIIDPDTFLLDRLDLAPPAVTDELTRQASPKSAPAQYSAEPPGRAREGRRAVVCRRASTSNHLSHLNSASAPC
ncbi:MAG: hypothetical protein AB7H92_04195 [Microbacteriaceae bacterium]